MKQDYEALLWDVMGGVLLALGVMVFWPTHMVTFFQGPPTNGNRLTGRAEMIAIAVVQGLWWLFLGVVLCR